MITLPFTSHSWEIVTESIATKRLDKSAFLHHGTAIPNDICFFFDIDDTANFQGKQISLRLNGESINAHITKEQEGTRLRLFWDWKMRSHIEGNYPETFKAYQSGNSPSTMPPKLFLTKVQQDTYEIGFNKRVTPEWTDLELKETITAYFKILRQEASGQHVNKSEINKILREGVLRSRSKGSIEFRMQNISAVLASICHPTVEGYKSRGNVGDKVRNRMLIVINDLGFIEKNLYEPSNDQTLLDNKVEKILSIGIKGKPKGSTQTQSVTVSKTEYYRDPLVKAWTLQNASGVCDLCNHEGPFIDKSGKPFLEVHHIIPLAENGTDTVDNVAALCPNCHRKCHHALDKHTYIGTLKEIVKFKN